MIFRQATRRLTAAFTAILLLLFGAFALGIYFFVTGTFDYDTVAGNGAEAVDAAEQGFVTLRTAIVVCYLVLLVIVPVMSYIMARLVLAPVRRSYEKQQAFVDDASHEFRTPLAIIQGELELAISRPRTPLEYERAIVTTLEEVEHLTTLTGDLLLLTRGSEAELQSAFTPVDISEVTRKAVRSSAAAAQISIEGGVQHSVLGSEHLLIRALGNVLDNATKFADTGTPIEVKVGARGDKIQITIRDHGPGMTPETLNHVFDRFWRAEESRSLPGHGLGLALVRQICVAHHGSISIESVPGHGTTVSVVLPAIRKPSDGDGT
ncbi:hypothetical protein B7R54_19380 [Subtercola boreus]|uniref:histidine kinase n=1 Tax=Subtercola boreus TaxID=120213 RepID=A0A3E0VA09_9MICO|nr:HAMP domain-containing sensor histidine kinase [Subtercola boreus]RFA06529.1 hypothetical protein B7R54_19380 [Subtercola boreus]TQL46827.1 signal transduction histidine kinase [Subtercola boreus]